MSLWVCLALSHAAFSQVSNDYIDTKVDSAFDYVYLGAGSEDARRIAHELLEIDQQQGSFRAKVNAYQIIGETFYYTAQTDSALYWYYKAHDYAVAEKDSSEIAYTALSIGSVHEQLNNYDKTLSFLQTGLDMRTSMKDTSEMVFILMRKAWLNLSSDRHVLAMHDFTRGRDISELRKDSADWCSCLNGMGNVHKKQKNYSQSESVFKEAIAMCDAIGDRYGSTASKGNLAMVYKSLGRFDEAYSVFPEILPYYEESNYTDGRMFCYANMAVINHLMGNFKASIKEAEQAIVLSQEIGRRDTESDMLKTMADCQLALGNMTEALLLAKDARQLAYDGFYVEKQRDAEKTLSNVYAQLGKYDLALTHFKAHTALSDSLLSSEKSKQILELQTLYETAKTEAKSARTESENAQLKSNAEVASLRQNALLIGLAVILLLGGIIWNRETSRRKKANELHDAEIKLGESEKQRLQDQLDYKNRELAAQALHLAQKNDMLQQIQDDLKLAQDKDQSSEAIGGVMRKLNVEKQLEHNWDQFLQTFTATNGSFFSVLTNRYGKLSKNEMRLAALLKMNLGSKEIAHILNISDEGVKKARYRLRKKLELESSESLESALLNIAS